MKYFTTTTLKYASNMACACRQLSYQSPFTLLLIKRDEVTVLAMKKANILRMLPFNQKSALPPQ